MTIDIGPELAQTIVAVVAILAGAIILYAVFR